MMDASDPLFRHQPDYGLPAVAPTHRVVERPRPQRSGGRIDANDDARRRSLRDSSFHPTTVARPPRTASGVPPGRSSTSNLPRGLTQRQLFEILTAVNLREAST